MEYRIQVSENRDYILLVITGDFTAGEMMGCVMESHALGLQEDIHCYLTDVTNARNIDSVAGNFEFAHTDMKATQGVDPRARVAGLVSPGDHSHDFVETVTAAAGMDLKLFTDLKDAIAFLHEKR